MRRGRGGVAALLATGAVLAAGPAAAGPEVTAGQAAGRIRIDGVLDEPDWARAGVIRELVQQEPRPGEPTPFATEVRVLADEGALYVGFVCHDPDPGAIAVHTMQRDGNVEGDDTVTVVLDTFGDGRRGYAFQVNAAGARVDGLISDPERMSRDWDGIWDAAARRTPDGWTVELWIPAQTLRFTPGAPEWGFNVERRVARERLTLRWAGVSLDARITDLRRTGRLRGVQRLRQGRGLSVSPFGLLRREAEVGSRSSVRGDGGLDVTYNLTPDLAAIVTVNTDFAETEVDARRIDLSRFELFFPEKRAFFLEGSNLFSFGTGLGRDFIPFFSRRIGLYRGREVPLLGGVKLLGSVGRWNLAVLDTVTGDAGQVRGTNLFAGRVSYDVTGRLTVGAIVTDGDPDGIHDNRLVGVDVLWRTSSFRGDKNLSVGGWAAWSAGDVPTGRRSGWGFKVDYPNDRWDVFLAVKEFGDALDPALGFLPRPGTRWYQGGGSFRPRPDPEGPLGWIRQAFFQLFSSYAEDLAGRPESWRVFTAPLNVELESGDRFELNWMPRYERLDEPFELAEGVVIPPGEYRFTRYRVEVEGSGHRRLAGRARVWFGTFYTGRLTQWEGSLAYTTARGNLQLELRAQHDQGHLPEGDFINRLWQLRVVYAFTPDLVLSSYTQYDSNSRDLGTNTRLRWTVRPGNDLYVVWNRGWRYPPGARERLALRPVSDRLVVKLRWTWRS